MADAHPAPQILYADGDSATSAWQREEWRRRVERGNQTGTSPRAGMAPKRHGRMDKSGTHGLG